MSPFKKTILLIKIAKVLRMLGNGFLIIIFLQNLYQKEMQDQYMYVIQGALYIGTATTSYFIKANLHRIGTKNALLLSTLLMTLTSIVFGQSKDIYYLFGMSFIGMMPVVGEDLQIFSSIQLSILAKLVTNKSKTKEELVQNKIRQFRSYKILGQVSQIIGCIVASYFVYIGMKSVQTSDTIFLYILRAYTIFVSLQFLIYLSLDRQQIQTSSNSIDQSKVQKEIVECIRPGSFMLITFLVFFCTSILNMTNFLYFLHQKYVMEIPDIAPFIISLIFINYLASYLTKKLVQKRCGNLWLMIGLPFNLMLILVALTQKLSKWQSITIVANIITNSFILNVWQKLKYKMMTQYEIQNYQGNFSFFRHLGTVFAIIVYAIFSMFGGTNMPYSVSIIISGGFKFAISLILVSYWYCLGNFSYNVKQIQEMELQDIQFQQIKSYGDENEGLHLPNTH